MLDGVTWVVKTAKRRAGNALATETCRNTRFVVHVFLTLTSSE